MGLVGLTDLGGMMLGHRCILYTYTICIYELLG